MDGDGWSALHEAEQRLGSQIVFANQKRAAAEARATAAEERVATLEAAMTYHKHTDDCLAYAASTGKSYCIAPCMDARTALGRERGRG